jgi:hypothetical protein
MHRLPVLLFFAILTVFLAVVIPVSLLYFAARDRLHSLLDKKRLGTEPVAKT